jgi:hypothetical protein
VTARRGGTYGTVAAALVLLAAVLRFWGLTNGLPHPLTRPDEEVMLNHVAPLARGDFDLRYAVYPSFYFYVTWLWSVLALGAAGLLGLVPREPLSATLAAHPERVLLAGRALSATAATLTVPVLMGFTRRAVGRPAAVLAGALLATNLLNVRDAHAAKPDALLTLGVTVALAVMAGYVRVPSRRRAALIGMAIGLTMGIKYPAVLLLVPAWVATAFGSRAPGWRRWCAADTLVIAATAAAAFVVTSPYLVLDSETRHAMLGVLGSIFPSLFPGLVPPALPPALLAMAPARHWWSGFAYHLSVSFRHGTGVLPSLLALPALAWGCVALRAVGRILVVWIAVYFVVHGLSPMLLSRYMTPALPAAFLLEAGLVTTVLRRLGVRWRGPVGALAAAAVVALPFANCVAYDRILARRDTRLLATEWLAAHARPGSRVLVAGTVFWGYGEPLMPPGVERLRLETGAAQLPPGVAFVVTHDHPTFASRFDPVTLAPFADHLRLVLDLDPFVGPPERAVFEEYDAYYVPLDGFDVVERTGPHIRIYAVEG